MHEYLHQAHDLFDAVRKHYQDYHSEFALEPNLKNSAIELFPAQLRDPVRSLVNS